MKGRDERVSSVISIQPARRSIIILSFCVWRVADQVVGVLFEMSRKAMNDRVDSRATTEICCLQDKLAAALRVEPIRKLRLDLVLLIPTGSLKMEFQNNLAPSGQLGKQWRPSIM